MKKLLLFLATCLSLVTTSFVSAKDVDYNIRLYWGRLTLNKDNTATFQQDLVYDFASSYNGQYVTLGSAGNVPKGFKINSNPEVKAYEVNEQGKLTKRPIKTKIEQLSDGYRAKVYNGGHSGDRVVLSLKWKLHHVTTIYSDIAELNWTPISDWDAPLDKVVLTVKGPSNFLAVSRFHAHTGYFKKQPKVTQKNGNYEVNIEGLGKNKKLELHAYWNRSDFAVATDKSSKRLSKFQALEAKIARRQKFYPLLVGWLFPMVSAILILISIVLYATWKAVLGQRKAARHMHLFSPPADLSPLILSRYVYDLEIQELSPLKTKRKRYDLGFKELIQASLLDLIDQGKLVIADDHKSFFVPDWNRLESYEKRFLIFVYGDNKKTMPIDGAFDDYKIDKSIFKGSNETEIRRRGGDILHLFENRMEKLDKAVKNKISSLSLNDIHRERTGEEKTQLILVYFFASTAMLFAFFVGAFALIKGYWLGLGTNLLLLIVASLFLIFYRRKDDYYNVSSLLTQEGLAIKQGWDSFENMIRDIKRFDDVELEGVIIWNRILVYATLYGYAERVQNYLKVKNIHLQNPQMNAYLEINPSYYVGQSTADLSTYTSTATSASNFSVSSGGSSGGGFSGGGGGGGGGAF